MLPFDDCPARDFLRGLGQAIGRPRAIVIASAHWDTMLPMANGPAVNETIHDFGGFPKALYDLRYPAPGDAALAAEVAGDRRAGRCGARAGSRRLGAAAVDVSGCRYSGGAVVSVQSAGGAAHHIALGRKLAKLRDDNVLVMGSGGFVHNLRLLDREHVNAPTNRPGRPNFPPGCTTS